MMAGWATRYQYPKYANGNSKGVRKHVAGIAEQSDAARQPPADRFNQHYCTDVR
jgi:hypothetical protein